MSDKNFRLIFKSHDNVYHIVERLGLYLGQKINFEEDILFLDEIQESPEALALLKYFYQFLP